MHCRRWPIFRKCSEVVQIDMKLRTIRPFSAFAKPVPLSSTSSSRLSWQWTPAKPVQTNCTKFTCTAAREIFLFTCSSAYSTKAGRGVWDASCAGDQPCGFASSTPQKNNLCRHLWSKSTLFLLRLHLLSTRCSLTHWHRQPCNYRATKGKLKRP